MATPLSIPDGTNLTVRVLKPHPGLVELRAVAPNGESFLLMRYRLSDPAKIALNEGAAGLLPVDWPTESKAQRTTRLKREQNGR